MAATTVPGCFACHVDCATGCAADDQPFDHPDYADYKIPSFDEKDADEAELRSTRLHSNNSKEEPQDSDKGMEISTDEPAEGSSLMRFVLWALNVKTDTGA
ncbi:expressed unknown protein [Ectocarpus siliculosus]|uniref:Uncharacterized protein n=1 Tax=Ectocarpus siliculosus TaxID=2880 RepID=D8LRV0_ECTSI|nr:expressed unknown protein [Ectocarpus siliculosus]|eukprot:CBN73867.1 expressed unknown protein [Ectocarpus siliculosus]